MNILDWAENNFGKVVLLLLAAAALCGLLFLIWLGAVVENIQIMRACEAQGGIYLKGDCKKPSDIIVPK